MSGETGVYMGERDAEIFRELTENEMVDDFIRFMKGKYPGMIKEVPFLSRCIDVAYINLNDEVISIEFKLKNWRHAIRQARDHALGADRVYIGLPAERVSEEMKRAVQTENIGLLLYISREIFYECVPAPLNMRRVSFFNNILKNTMRNILDTTSGDRRHE
jgi:hypothetical protein